MYFEKELYNVSVLEENMIKELYPPLDKERIDEMSLRYYAAMPGTKQLIGYSRVNNRGENYLGTFAEYAVNWTIVQESRGGKSIPG